MPLGAAGARRTPFLQLHDDGSVREPVLPPPSHACDLSLLLGIVFEFEHTAAAPRDAFLAAARLQPKNSVLRTFVSYSHVGEGEFSVNREENARRQYLEQAIELDPKNCEARWLLARYYASLGNLDEAEEVLAAALEENSDYLDAVFLQCDLDARRGLEPLANARLNRVLKVAAARAAAGGRPVPHDLLRRLLELEKQDEA